MARGRRRHTRQPGNQPPGLPGPPPPSIAREVEMENRTQPAIFAFNQRPERGIPLLCEAFGVPCAPRPVAHILHVVSGLLGRQIGEYLSRPENSEVLASYFFELDLEYPFLDALRAALNSSLQLPAESEQIDRIVQIWAQCWVRRNPKCGLDPDQAYILAFATVLLNTDLHSPSVTRRMTERQFINNMRGAIPAEAITDSALSEIYNSVKTRPFQIRRDDDEALALSSPKLRGYLSKKSGLLGQWVQFHFVLTDGLLYYFESSKGELAEKPHGVIRLGNVNAQPLDSDRIVLTAQDDEISYVKFQKKPAPVHGCSMITLRAPSQKVRDKWLYRIRSSTVYRGFSSEAEPLLIAPGEPSVRLTEIPATAGDDKLRRIARSVSAEFHPDDPEVQRVRPECQAPLGRPAAVAVRRLSLETLPVKGAEQPRKRMEQRHHSAILPLVRSGRSASVPKGTKLSPLAGPRLSHSPTMKNFRLNRGFHRPVPT